MPKLPGPPRKPWSMKWIVIAIILFVGIYSYLTLKYRKPNHSYEPYNDIKQRGLTHNLLTAGYQRIPLKVDHPTNPQPLPATAVASNRSGGLPAKLIESLFDQPALADSYAQLKASAQGNALMPYTIMAQSLTNDERNQVAAAYAYVQHRTVFIVPEIETLDGKLTTRRRDNPVRLVIPGGTLRPGDYEVSLVGAKSSLGWTLQVH